MGYLKALEYTYVQMGKNMKGIGMQGENMEEESRPVKMEMFMKVSLWMSYLKVLEYKVMQMDKNMKGITRLGKNMEKEYELFLTEMFMKENL